MFALRALVCATFVLSALPAFAQQNDYGGYDIVGAPQGEYAYGETLGWQVYAAADNGHFAYCYAETLRGDGSAVRLGWDGMQWQLAVPIRTQPDWQGSLQVDGAGSGQGYQRGGDYISGTAVGGWTIAWLGMAELDGLRQGSEAVLGVGKFDYDFSLSGATAASLLVEECVADAGASTGSAGSDEPPPEAMIVAYGTAGSFVINTIEEAGRVIACEAWDTANPVIRYEIDRDHTFVDFKDGGPMGDLGSRETVRLLYGPGSAPDTAEIEFIEGRDGDKWARIAAERAAGPGLLDDAIPNSTQISFVGQNVILETDLTGTNRTLDVFFACSDAIR